MKTRKTQLRRNVRRNARGVSLTELVIASLLLGVSLAVVAELMSTAVVANTKLSRQFDAQVSSRAALDRMKRDIRMCASICPGKWCREKVLVDGVAVPVHDDNDLVLSQRNLSSSCLILHMPILFLDKKNDPQNASYEPGAPQNPLNGVTLPGYDTLIYEAQQDPDDPTIYRLVNHVLIRTQGNEFRKSLDCSYRTATDPLSPRPFSKGIIGPLALGAPPNAIPKVFSYLSRNPLSSNLDLAQLDVLKESTFSGAQASSPLLDTLCKSISGVGIDLELKRATEGSQIETSMDKVHGVHTEAVLRIPPSQIGIAGAYYEDQ